MLLYFYANSFEPKSSKPFNNFYIITRLSNEELLTLYSSDKNNSVKSYLNILDYKISDCNLKNLYDIFIGMKHYSLVQAKTRFVSWVEFYGVENVKLFNILEHTIAVENPLVGNWQN